MIVPVIVGATGSGKTGVAIEIAKTLKVRDGVLTEIVAADSRTVYKGMDIGTAKPSMDEREGIVHHGFDMIEPNERFTVKDFKDFAEEKIREVIARKNLPMVVGGTGLYIDALVFDYQFKVVSKGYGQSRGECIKNLNGRKGTLPQSEQEKYPDRKEMSSQYKIFGIFWEPEELKKRLYVRADGMFRQELYDETERLVKKYGWKNQAMTGDIYGIAWRLMKKEISREEAVRLAAIKDWHLAKRQMTWFKRNEKILWLSLERVKTAVIKCIQNEYGK